MSADGAPKKSILEQMIAISSLIFAVILICVIAIPQTLQALFRLIYCQRKEDVEGKLAIVTGGGSHLGQCIVRKLAERGCNLLIVDDNLTKIERLAEEVRSQTSVRVSVYCAKTCENQDVFRLFDKVSEKFANIDLLINTPQLLNCGDDSAQLIAEKMSRSFNSTMTMTLKFLEKFERQHGSAHIVTVSPCAGLSHTPDYKSDELTFSFMNSVNDHLRERKLHKRIKTTCVLPCFVQNGRFITEFLNKYFKFNSIDVNTMADEIIEGITTQDGLVELPNNFTNLTKFWAYIARLIFFIFSL